MCKHKEAGTSKDTRVFFVHAQNTEKSKASTRIEAAHGDSTALKGPSPYISHVYVEHKRCESVPRAPSIQSDSPRFLYHTWRYTETAACSRSSSACDAKTDASHPYIHASARLHERSVQCFFVLESLVLLPICCVQDVVNGTLRIAKESSANRTGR